MKFSQMPYHRPDIDGLARSFRILLSSFTASENAATQVQVINEINTLRNRFETLMTIANVKYTQDTSNPFNQQEQDYFDDKSPEFFGLVNDFYKAILQSAFRKELETRFGQQLFAIAEMTVKTFSPEVMEELKKENQLTSEYTKLVSSAQIPFEGGIYAIPELGSFLNSDDRNIRKAANEAKYRFFAEHGKQLDDIFDRLVKLRTSIAIKLGFKNFTELGYARMLRLDYNQQMVAGYREQVYQSIVPIAGKLKSKQTTRLQLDKLRYYDEALMFNTGNANPKGSPEWIVNNARKMYAELSPETNEFFQFMVDNEMMDLVSRKGKAPGGYCTYLNDYKSPFIFSNFNGTTHDIEVLTHEAGHAFQVYSSRNLGIPEYNFPTYEACEIHSMSMEFLTWPWMELFFREDTEKFKFSHLAKSLQFLPYGVAIDEFQHWVYEHPDASPAERNTQYRKIEKKYIPFRDYDNNEYLENGCFWHQQSHVYKTPFYYIDYTLAQTCAFQFWKKANENRQKAMEDYIRLCRKGGSKSFLELVSVANLVSPFQGGCLESVAAEVEQWLENVDDRKL